MNSEATEFVFTGGEGLTCHRFIRAIREQAFNAGKQRDDQWMADCASIRFDGEALEWFEGLEDDTQKDWTLLRRAVLARYSAPTNEEPADLPQALKEGKQRDDEWIADYASVLFKGEALQWFESLEDETQKNWKSLRRALLARYSEPADEVPPSTPLPDVVKFEGRGVEECQIFARWVRRKAQSEGENENDSWMARLAFQSFTGPALQWYAHLLPDVRKSWSRLELALICQYPYTTSSALSPARIRVLDWNVRVSASEALHSLKSHDQWLAAAKERRAKWAIANDPSVVCWVLVEAGQPIPSNAMITGQSHCGPLRYSARTWYKGEGLLVGRSGHDLGGGARFAHNGKDIWDVKPYEVLVGDPSLVHWVTVPKKTPTDGSAYSIKHKPFLAIEGGFWGSYPSGTATFISQVPMKGHVQAGKAISTRYNVYVGSERVEKLVDHVQVLAWADYQ